MNNKINGIEIYKMGLYACIEGPAPNLRGSFPQITSPNITVLDTVQNLSKNIYNHSNISISNYDTQNNLTNIETISNITQNESSISIITSTVKPPTEPPTEPPTISNTIPPTISNTIPPTISPTISPTTISINNTNNSQINLFNQNMIQNTIQHTPQIISTTNIIIISICSGISCCGILFFFIYKAHVKSKHRKNKENEKINIENGEKLNVGQIANAVYYSNKMRSKLGNRGKHFSIKNRNSWSRDTKIKPGNPSLVPKLPEPSIKVSVNTYKNKKPGLSLDTTEVPTKTIQIKEITQQKTHSSFVPGSPRRRLPTPPQRAPPPPAPSFASKSLASKLDRMNNSKLSPKIQRIVQKNK